MSIRVVIELQNPNALIAMAQVTENKNNPYFAFCEYIKYCISANSTDVMTIKQVRDAVGKEFGINIPHNIILKCLLNIQRENIISLNRSQHQIFRTGSYDTVEFDNIRNKYRATEAEVICGLVKFASNHGRIWTDEQARELLIKVLDRTGLAYDIFLKNRITRNSKDNFADSLADLEAILPDDEEQKSTEVDEGPLFTDEFYVGKYVKKVLDEDSVQKEYLQNVCGGLMLCAGVFQLPTSEKGSVIPQIKGTPFFFDTKLLLRVVGCAGEAAVSSAKELVELIQKAGGNIYYFPHTLDEINNAFDDAIKRLRKGEAPKDNEMRMYSASINHSLGIFAAKKASIQGELSKLQIHLRKLETYSDDERIRFGFDKDELQKYMFSKLSWETKTIENDAQSIWETHMRRQGNYQEYCGTSDHLSVFVTTNSRLIGIALDFRESHPHMSGISGWQNNRLPVITDIRLTCRLWSPASQGERLSLLYLAANAVAAQRPTERYLNRIRELATELEKSVPEYSEIPLPAFFDDNITETIFERINDSDDNLDIGTFASSIAELSEWKAKEQEEISDKYKTERDQIRTEYSQQTKSIIEGAVEKHKNKLGWRRIALLAILYWPAIVAILFAGVSTIVSCCFGNWHPMLIAAVVVAIAAVEHISASRFAVRWALKRFLPRIISSYENSIAKELRKAELQYKDEIIYRSKEETLLLKKASGIME